MGDRNFNHFLLPTDFSEENARAIEYGVHMSSVLRGELYLQHILPVSITTGSIAKKKVHTKEEQNAQQALAEIKKSIRSGKWWGDDDSGIKKIHLRLGRGSVAQEIVKESQSDCDLLIMGTKGQGGIKTKLFGTNTQNVIDIVDKPVLVVPSKASETYKTEKVLYIVNLDVDIDASLMHVIHFCKLFDAELIIAHINILKSKSDMTDLVASEKMRGDLVKKCKIAQSYKKSSYRVINSIETSFDKTVNDFVLENGVDLVSLVKRKSNILQYLFRKSISKQLALHTLIPVLIFHE